MLAKALMRRAIPPSLKIESKAVRAMSAATAASPASPPCVDAAPTPSPRNCWSKDMAKITVDPNYCKGCLLCVRVCRRQVLKVAEHLGPIPFGG